MPAAFRLGAVPPEPPFRHAIEVAGLRKVYTNTRGTFRRTKVENVALDGIDLAIEPGELFGLLGPNGAGKTTTVKILTTLLLPTAGTARVLGHDVVSKTNDVRRRIGQSSLERIFLELGEDADVVKVANEIVDVVVAPS